MFQFSVDDRKGRPYKMGGIPAEVWFCSRILDFCPHFSSVSGSYLAR